MRANYLALILAFSAPAAADPVRIDISGDTVVGLSGLEVSEDGSRFLAVGDRGWFLEGRLEREDGVLTGGAVEDVKPILGGNGWPVSARQVGDWSDAEGLAMAADGTFWVSFERWTRAARFEGTEAAAGYIRDHPSFRDYEDNRQLEAIAVDTAGRILAFPETPLNGSFPVYRLEPEGWEIVGSIAPSDGYSIVGADIASDGTVYLLERKLVFATWFRSRLSVLGPDWSRRVIWESEHGEFDNLEGVSVWEAPEGRRAVMVSDNNGRPEVPTEIVELRLTD